jgi:hypothetical protein
MGKSNSGVRAHGTGDCVLGLIGWLKIKLDVATALVDAWPALESGQDGLTTDGGCAR